MGRIRLVASDLDGTLLLDWGKTGIDPEVFEQISELKRRGVWFLASSGRQYFNLRNLFAPVADDILYLCENGAVVLKDDEVIVKSVLDRGLAEEACRVIAEMPRVSPLICGAYTNYVYASEPEFIEHMRNFVGTKTTPIERFEDIKDEIVKVSFYAKDPKDLEAAAPVLEKRFGNDLKAVTSGASWFDMMPKGVDKGTAMAALGRAIGIEPEQMMAFGDNFNDAEMLDYVGHPYLMESGRPELRDLNDRIKLCTTVNDCLRGLLDEPGVF